MGHIERNDFYRGSEIGQKTAQIVINRIGGKSGCLHLWDRPAIRPSLRFFQKQPGQRSEPAAYAYHRDANIQQILDQPHAETLSFAYDILDRLDEVYLDGVLVDDPSYDSQGNLDFHGTSADPRDLAYAAPANHRATGLNGETYAYDANGNLTSRTAGGVTYALSYDAENRLVSYAGGTVAAEFVYDGDGQRVMTVAGSGTTRHVGSHFEVFIPAEPPEPTSTPTSASTETPTSAPTPTETATGTPTPAATATVTPTATATGTSFPYNSVLDDFNRANGGVGASWSGDTGWYAIDGQALKATASDKVIYWNGASYGANQEAYFELSTIDPDGVEMGLALKVDAGGGAIYSAIEVFYSQSGQNVQVWTYARGGQGWVQRGSYSVTLANGDQLGAAATAGGQVRVYRNGVLLTTVDVSGWPYYQNGGYIGVWMVSAEDARLDDFGGGTLPTSMAPSRPQLAGLDLDGLKSGWERVIRGMQAWWARLWSGGTYASLDVAQGELRLRPAVARQLNTPPAGQVWRKYYFAGSARIAVREVKDGGASDTLSYLLSDHLGSLSEVVAGASVSAARRYAIVFTWVSG